MTRKRKGIGKTSNRISLREVKVRRRKRRRQRKTRGSQQVREQCSKSLKY